MYNLSNIPNFNDILENREVNNKYIKVLEIITKTNEKYKIIKYDKSLLNLELFQNYGLLRSVILNENNKIIGFAPVKSINSEIFINNYSLNDTNIIAQEFVEGTMINLFFNDYINKWEISTKNNIGGENYFYKNDKNKTFKIMFEEACTEIKLDINKLNKLYCYSFVLQHPDNIIVVPFKKPQLYIVEIFEIKNIENNFYVISFPSLFKETSIWENSNIKFPQIYNLNNYNQLIDKYASINTPYNILGFVLKNINNGIRTKIRNPNYEEVRQLKGNQPKLQYQYLVLRNKGKIKDFLKYFPECKKNFSIFRDQIHFFTTNLHQNYIDCYIKHKQPLNTFSPQFKNHMYKLHQIYINELMINKKYVSLKIVINYINNLHPSLLMYSLNYNLRKNIINCNTNDNI